MELLLIWHILRRWWWLVAIPVLITALIAAPALLRRGESGGFTRTITYTGLQNLDAIPRPQGDYQDIWLSSELLVRALSNWVKDSSFLDAVVVQAPNTDITNFGIATDYDHSIGQIYLSDPSVDDLDTLSKAVITVLTTDNQKYFAQLGGKPADITILGETPITPAPPPLTNRLGPLIRIALGLIAGIGLAFLAHYLDPVLRRREEIETLGLPILGSIPRE